MLPAAERLRRDSLFQRTYAGRKSTSSPLVTLYVLSRQAKSAPRLPLVGFVAGKKVHADAVRRNRAKRRIREAYRLSRERFPGLTQWYSMVWVIHSKALDASFEEILKTVHECLAAAARKYGDRRQSREGTGAERH